MNAIAPILSFARTRQASCAIIEGERTVTYGELARMVRRTACHLTANGLVSGDRIGLCLKDTIDHLVAFLAIAHIGAVAVPLDWRARPNENARFIEKLALACVLSDARIRSLGDCRMLRQDAVWHDAIAQAEEADQHPINSDLPLVISASSGSSGAPKFTQMTHRQFHFAISGMLELMQLAGPHRFLCAMPLYYSGGRNSCLAHLFRGDCVVLYPSLFTAAEYLQAIEQHRITVAGVVPSVIRQLLAFSGEEPLLPGLATLFSTGAPLHAEEKRRAAIKLTPHFHERYGTAETMAISVLRPPDFAHRVESVGQPHSLAEVEVVDENDQPLPPEAIGRLRYRGPGSGSPLPGDTMASFREGWYYPGEIARLDEAGYIFLHGRTSDVILRHGAKIYPAEVEATLLDHPEVVEAAVIGHTDASAGDPEQFIVAFVVLKSAIGTGELLAHCRARLTSHKVPRKIHVAQNLPRNTAGKIDKFALESFLAEGV